MATDSQNWFYRDFASGSPVQGPFTIDELVERAWTGELAYNALVRCGDGEWIQADRVKELLMALRHERAPKRKTYESPAPRPVIRVDRRRLNWGDLFVRAVVLGVIATVLIIVGMAGINTPLFLLFLLGQILAVISSATFLCAIIRWAIEPLFAQMVDTNDHLVRIANVLKKADEQKD